MPSLFFVRRGTEKERDRVNIVHVCVCARARVWMHYRISGDSPGLLLETAV